MRLLTLLTLLLASTSFASGWSTQELKALQQKEANIASFFPKGMEQLNKDAQQRSQQYQSWASDLNQQAQNSLKNKNPDSDVGGVMIFASLGMPDASLKQLLRQASEHNVPIVLRGLWQNDFKATANKIQSLILSETDTILGGFEINPVWFKQFGITHVPAFVAVKKGACLGEPPCDTANYDVLYGNISLYNAFELLQKQGQHKDVVREYQ